MKSCFKTYVQKVFCITSLKCFKWVPKRRKNSLFARNVFKSLNRYFQVFSINIFHLNFFESYITYYEEKEESEEKSPINGCEENYCQQISVSL